MAYTEYGVSIAVLNTGDGNPSTAYAASKIAKREEVPNTVLSLDRMGKFAGILHKIMTRFASQAYTEHSSNLRGGVGGKMLAALCYRELLKEIVHADKTQNFNALRLFVVQEFMLLGATPEELRALYNDVFLIVPDVFPKASAVASLEEKKELDARLLVWNLQAYHHVREALGPEGVQLYAPFLVDGLADFAKVEREKQDGRRPFDVIVKSSGSGGISEKQARQILDACNRANLTVFIQTPNAHYNNQVYLQKPRPYPNRGERFAYPEDVTKRERIDHFYGQLSEDTQIIISYPSEMVQVAAEMMAKGVKVKFIALPPRGEHEAKNLIFAIEAGLCVAVLKFDGNKTEFKQPMKIGDKIISGWQVPDISPNEIGYFAHETVVTDKTVTHVKSLLGTEHINTVLRPN